MPDLPAADELEEDDDTERLRRPYVPRNKPLLSRVESVPVAVSFSAPPDQPPRLREVRSHRDRASCINPNLGGSPGGVAEASYGLGFKSGSDPNAALAAQAAYNSTHGLV